MPDEFSPFRYHLRNIKRHARQTHSRNRVSPREISITLEDLKNQWDKQKGLCPLTGWRMINPITINRVPPLSPRRASVDRIDSSKGYTKENIRFVCWMVQMAKHSFTDKEVIKFCQAVVLNEGIKNESNRRVNASYKSRVPQNQN